MRQEFHIILEIRDLSEQQADALYDAGFDDSHISKHNGYVCIIVDDRDSDDFEATIRAAVADAQSAGLPVRRVVVPAVEHVNAELAAGASA